MADAGAIPGSVAEPLKTLKIFRGAEAPSLDEAGHMTYVEENERYLTVLRSFLRAQLA